MCASDQFHDPVEVVHPALLIRINKLYREDMTPLELYEATRGIWKLGPRREKARYGLAVYKGIVREVYRIDSWQPALTTPYATRNLTAREAEGRWEFVGEVAEAAVSDAYVDRSVKDYFVRGHQNPVFYVNT